MKPIYKLTLCFLLYATQSLAQKLPDVQKEGLRASAAVKIDGKLEEWGSLSAYNKRIVVYYSIANDDENLYLLLRSDNSLITGKILQGGLTFSVNTVDKKEKDAVSVTYPFIADDKQYREMISLLPGAIGDGSRMSAKEQKEAEARRQAARAPSNRKILNLFKFIRINGIKEINDKQVPIYNDLGIKTAATIDSSGAYCYELALPLKFLDIPQGSTFALHYNIKLLAKHRPDGMPVATIITRDGGPPLGEGGVDLRSMTVATDFWGEYLLKK
jgi:hypothetical protein